MATEPIHVDLSDLQPGAHAKVTPADEVSYGARRAVERAVTAVEDGAARVDAYLVARVRALVPEWKLVGKDGKPLPAPAHITLAQLEALPSRLVGRIVRAVDREWARAIAPDEDADPNAPATPTSSTSSPA